LSYTTTSAAGGCTSVIDTLVEGNDGILSMLKTGGTIDGLKDAYEKEPEYTTSLL